MNKQKIISDLRKKGIILRRFDVSYTGYEVELELDPKKAQGWEEVLNSPFEGFEIATISQTSAFTMNMILIPANKEEFKDFIKKCIASGMEKKNARALLISLVEEYGSESAKGELKNTIE